MTDNKDNVTSIEEVAKKLSEANPPNMNPAGQQCFAVPPALMKQVIDLIDEHISGKLGRPITNALERCPVGSFMQPPPPPE